MSPTPKASAPGAWLKGGGEMAKCIRAKDWSTTALGPIESWPQSLRTVVSLAQASESPMSLAWGSGHVQIYNDGYWPICGDKHPTSMGQDYRECWASAWPVIGEAYHNAWEGKSGYLEKMRMFLDRYGFLEECWFTFSFSPISDESGGIGGLFHPVTELTGQMLSERRTRTLRDLASRTGKAKTTDEAQALVLQVLAESDLDVPFVLLYAFDREGDVSLVGATGIARGTPVSPERVDLATSAPWDIDEVARSAEPMRLDDAPGRLAGVPAGPYPEAPKVALIYPIVLPGDTVPTAVLIAGSSARLVFDEAYRAFFDLVANAVTTALGNARAHEEERERAEALAEIDRAKTAFFSNVSHEFRTPLTLMLGPLEDEIARSAEPPENLVTAYRNSLRLLRLVNTLLDFSRIEAGRIQASFEPVDLARETAELASVFRSAAERAGLALTIDCPPLPEPLWVDRQMWEKIVLNLLSNAFKHTFEGGLGVTLAWRGHGVELAVSDSGVGIAEDELPRLFERFHRVQEARSRSHEGTGIGLALAQELVRLHGGAITVTSTPGKGSRFTVTLPAGTAHLPRDRLRQSGGSSQPGSTAAAFVNEALNWLPDAPAIGHAALGAEAAPDERQRIVWADDNADMRDYVTRLLGSRYVVIPCADGAEALAAVRRRLPDLVLSDVMMPNLDGFGLLRALRADATTRTLPIILLSARAGEEAALSGLEAGADDYLVKPFSARELLARVRTHLEQSRARKDWAAQLEQANQELEAFSYSVAHDLRAPLRAVDGFSKALLDEHAEKLDDQGRALLGRVRRAATRMGQLIEDLLDLSRIGRSDLRAEPLDMSEVAAGVAAELRRQDPSRTVELTVEPAMTACADERLVTIIFENLLANAWKFTSRKEQARIAVSSKADGGETVYTVSDNGAGFDMTHAEKLFLPFHRLHRASEYEGSGIGLAIVRRIVNRHGGRVWANARVGRGATFHFTLPPGGAVE